MSVDLWLTSEGQMTFRISGFLFLENSKECCISVGRAGGEEVLEKLYYRL